VTRLKAVALIVCAIAFAAVVALVLTPSKPHPAPQPKKHEQVKKRPAPEPRTRRRPRLSLEEQAALAAASYFEAQGSYDGDDERYRQRVGRLLASGADGVRVVRGAHRMRSRADAVDVRYANPLDALVLVSGTQRVGGRTFVSNIDVLLVREDGRYRVESANPLGDE
jgi:hypothetical protein